MSAKENKELIRKVFTELNEMKGDASRLCSLYAKICAPSFVGHSTFRGDMNLEQTSQIMSDYASISDLVVSVDDMVAERDKVATRYTLQFTHAQPFKGIPATGKKVVVKGVQIDRIVGGKRMEVWDFPDALGLLTQLGAIPRAGAKN